MKLKSTLKMLLCIGLATLALGCDSTSTDPAPVPVVNQVPSPPAVYTMTNAAGGNQIQHFSRNAAGALTPVASYATGGNGDGTNLNGSSNALFFDTATRRVFAVNAGNNTISALSQNATTGALTVLSTVASGGTHPISITASGNVVYVLNDGAPNGVPAAPANITGFQFNGNQLVPVNNSTQPLSAANPAPAQIEFSPSGTVLVVTERATNNIRTFTGTNGAANAGVDLASAGATPFGFDFTTGGILVVSQANGGAVNGSSTSSYSVLATGVATLVSNSIVNNQTGNCWVAVNPANTFAYTTNTGSNSISLYGIAANGALTLQGAGNHIATGAGTGPIDLGVSADGNFVYTLNGTNDSISAFSVGANGVLTAIAGGVAANGVPATSVGLIVQ